jgi:hypothetical protein
MQATGLVIVLATLVTAAAHAHTDLDAATCPSTIGSEQRASGAIPSGWAVATDGDASHPLMGITFYAGPPAQHASLVGDERAGEKGRRVVSWPLSAPETYWVACSYSRTNVVLQRQLPQHLKSCSVSYATQVRIGGLPQILKIECR